MTTTPLANPVKGHRARWDAKLRAAGHRITWQPFAKDETSRVTRWHGVCRRCNGVIECGTGRAQLSLDRRECQPAPPRPLLRVVRAAGEPGQL